MLTQCSLAPQIQAVEAYSQMASRGATSTGTSILDVCRYVWPS
jgi:hypothetical protein